MKRKWKIVAFALAIIAATVTNVTEVLTQNQTLSMNAVNVVSTGNDNVEWNCTTISTDNFVEYADCMVCGRYHRVSEWDTRSCNSGVFTWCYPGYIVKYYNCNNTVERTVDMTETSGCN